MNNDEFVDEDTEYHVHIRITRGAGVFIYNVDIDLPDKRKSIKTTGAEVSLDSARKKSREVAKYFLLEEIK